MNLPSHRRTQSSTALKNPESSKMLKIARTGRQPGNWSNIITGCKYSNPGNSKVKKKRGRKKVAKNKSSHTRASNILPSEKKRSKKDLVEGEAFEAVERMV